MVGRSLVGRELNRYKVLSVVGSGGFATVYRAVDTGLDRTVALKVLDPAAHHDPNVARRFLREGQAVASLDHPAVVPVYDAGESDDMLFLAMRLIEGSSLDDALRVGRRLTPDQIVAVVARIGGALDHAHGHGLVHRDVKPSNILLEDNDPRRAWLVDFGIAATARTMGRYTTGALGTAAYMAPEQSRPGSVGPPADVYSLACVAFEMVTGGRPYPGEDYVALLMAHVNAPVPRCGHPGIDALMARALAKDPSTRPASGGELARDLRQALQDGAGTTTHLPLPTDAPTQPHRPGDTRTAVAAASAAGPPPTVAQPRHDTLLHPQVHRPPPPAPPPQRPPPPAGPRGQAAPRPARRGRVALLAGVVALVVAAAATYLALPRTDAGTVRVRDVQGIVYRIPRSWQRTQEKPVTEYSVDGTVVATVGNFDAGVVAATDLLQEFGGDAPVCGSAPAARDVDGSPNAAECSNASGDVAVAVGAVRDRQFWVVTVHSNVPGDERDAFLDSLRLTDPETSA